MWQVLEPKTLQQDKLINAEPFGQTYDYIGIQTPIGIDQN